uniref:Uncharacterized protein n=1 Tax=Coccidioides posadasii RMSCC 3488 TaxID=454284 RepID=A0A0J6F675_COCPO|nr:hypothetical protein CPAG_00806 [Coccidioides posadasii RMSCC 3488]
MANRWAPKLANLQVGFSDMHWGFKARARRRSQMQRKCALDPSEGLRLMSERQRGRTTDDGRRWTSSGGVTGERPSGFSAGQPPYGKITPESIRVQTVQTHVKSTAHMTSRVVAEARGRTARPARPAESARVRDAGQAAVALVTACCDTSACCCALSFINIFWTDEARFVHHSRENCLTP